MKLPLLTFLACLSLTITSQAQNLIQNPGFEAGLVSWRPWVPPSMTESNISFTSIKTDARSGEFAARLYAKPGTRFTLLNKSPLLVTPGKRYRMSLWYRADTEESDVAANAGSFGVFVGLDFEGNHEDPVPSGYFFNTSGASTNRDPLRIKSKTPLPEKWTQLSFVFDAMPKATKVSFGISNWGVSGALQLDDIVFEAVDSKVPLTVLKD